MSVLSIDFLRRAANTPLLELLRRGPIPTLPWRASIDEAGLPAELAGLATDVVRRTRLWPSERRAVAEELVAHFRDGLNAGTDATQLATDFGDPKQAARLIRRAKRRNRPAAWQSWWWGSRGFAAAAVAYVAFGAYLLTVRPSITTDYLALANESTEARDDAAWPHYERILLRLDELVPPNSEEALRRSDGLGASPLDRVPGFHVTTLDLPPTATNEEVESARQAALQSWLAENEAWADELRRAAGLPTLGFSLKRRADFTEAERFVFGLGPPRAEPPPADAYWYDALTATLLPHTQALRGLADLTLADIRRSVREGDFDRAADNFIATLNLAWHAAEPPFAACLKVARWIEDSAYDELRAAFVASPSTFSDTALRSMADRVATPRRPLEHYLRGERLRVLDSLQRVYAANGMVSFVGLAGMAGEVNKDFSPLDEIKGPALAAFTPIFWSQIEPREAVERDAKEAFRIAREAAAVPLWKRPPDTSLWVDSLAAGTRDLLGAFGPNLAAIGHLHRRLEASREGAMVGIALERYRRDVSAWPDSLEQLAPQWIPSVPVDPISGGPLGYRLIDDKPVVYSLGRDGDDDEGREPAAMDPQRSEERGYVRDTRYPIGPPLTLPELADRTSYPLDSFDGDWVLWSHGKHRYMPPAKPAGFGAGPAGDPA